jgi:hypothetical protein
MSAHDADANPNTDTSTSTGTSGCDRPGRGGDRSLHELPTFDFRYLIDDEVSPAEVTVFPADPRDPVTEWLTVDTGTAVSLEDVR